jgi:hypothetical protein
MSLTTDEPFAQLLFFDAVIRAQLALAEAVKRLEDRDALVGRCLRRASRAVRDAHKRALQEIGFVWTRP